MLILRHHLKLNQLVASELLLEHQIVIGVTADDFVLLLSSGLAVGICRLVRGWHMDNGVFALNPQHLLCSRT